MRSLGSVSTRRVCTNISEPRRSPGSASTRPALTSSPSRRGLKAASRTSPSFFEKRTHHDGIAAPVSGTTTTTTSSAAPLSTTANSDVPSTTTTATTTANTDAATAMDVFDEDPLVSLARELSKRTDEVIFLTKKLAALKKEFDKAEQHNARLVNQNHDLTAQLDYLKSPNTFSPNKLKRNITVDTTTMTVVTADTPAQEAGSCTPRAPSFVFPLPATPASARTFHMASSPTANKASVGTPAQQVEPSTSNIR